ncbi:MAG: DUF6584 family protein [Actinomycetes bacterium]
MPADGEGDRRDPLSAARHDLASGRAWAARDRLAGMLAHHPADQQVLHLLASACWALGEKDAAGRWWFLTDQTGPDVEEALSAAIAARSSRHGR